MKPAAAPLFDAAVMASTVFVVVAPTTADAAAAAATTTTRLFAARASILALSGLYLPLVDGRLTYECLVIVDDVVLSSLTPKPPPPRRTFSSTSPPPTLTPPLGLTFALVEALAAAADAMTALYGRRSGAYGADFGLWYVLTTLSLRLDKADAGISAGKKQKIKKGKETEVLGERAEGGESWWWR